MCLFKFSEIKRIEIMVKTGNVIKSGKYKDLYFAFAYVENTIIASSLGRESEEKALEDIYMFMGGPDRPNMPLNSENSQQNFLTTSEDISELIEDLGKCFYGENIEFNDLEFEDKENFNFKVLQEVAKIPPGEVRTYKEIAENLNSKGYRAVGNALNKNPLPLIIPCHRVVKSDMTIGGFRGGIEMKKELLKREGIEFEGNKIITKKKR